MEKYQEYKGCDLPWVTALPAHWKSAKIKYLAKMKSGNMISAADISDEGQFPVYGGNGMRGYTNTATNMGTHILIGRQGALCGNVRLAKGPFYATEHAIVVYTNPLVDLNWYKYLLEMMNLNQYATSAAQPGLSVDVIVNKGAFIPPLFEQQTIATYLDHKTEQIDGIIADKEKLIELLKEKRQAIISEAVTRGLDTSAPLKDSGVDWIGQIPKHWEIKPLFTVAFENKAKNSGNQCANLLSLSYGKIIKKDIDTNFGLLPESFETYQIVEDGYTILRLTDLQNDKRSLRSGFVPEKGIITSAYVGLIPADDVDGLFLSDLLHAYDLMKIFYSLGNGVRQSMNYKDLKRLPILLPPKSEQKLISNYLRNKTAEIDDLISTAEQQVSLLKEYRQSIISEAVTGKIKVTDFQSDIQRRDS